MNVRLAELNALWQKSSLYLTLIAIVVWPCLFTTIFKNRALLIYWTPGKFIWLLCEGLIAPVMESKQDFLIDVKENLKAWLIQSLMTF